MIILNLLKEIKQRNRLLYLVGMAHVILFFIFLFLFFIDSREITGINAWIKPMKFASSISLYLLTFGWLLHYLPIKKEVKFISTGIVICMIAEMLLIGMQAARGESSHFNISTNFNAMVFAAMGNFIGINSLINLYVMILFFVRKVNLNQPMLHAWRAGLLLFFLGGISGGLMVSNMAHTISAADGGAGLPFVNWSTEHGDIRVAHFFTMHGLQLIPIFTSLVIIKYVKTEIQNLATIGFFVIYAALGLALHLQALAGLPLLSIY
jgi:hypothetical protein